MLGALLLTTSVSAATIPARAAKYERALIREAQRVWGLNAPIARFAAQIHQESAWRPDVCSPYACGLAQFTKATARDMCLWYKDLCPVNTFDPRWALRALVLYNKRLYDALEGLAATSCDRWAMTLASYNGGRGWVLRDRRLTRQRGDDPTRWWGHVEKHSNRAAWAFRENRGYPRRILRRLEPIYLAAGWPGELVCEIT